MSATTMWLTVIGIGMITFAIRLSFMLLLGRIDMPGGIQRALRFVPAAVLSAIIFPEVMRPGSTLKLGLDNPRLVPALLAVVVAWRTKNVLLTIAVGMAGLLIMQVFAK